MIFGKWEIKENANGGLDITHANHPGSIIIAAADEGYVLDVYDDDDENHASTFALYHELEGDEP
jgi:hypothetical protein